MMPYRWVCVLAVVAGGLLAFWLPVPDERPAQSVLRLYR